MDNVQEADIVSKKNAGKRNNYYSIHTFEVKIPLGIKAFVEYKVLLENCCKSRKDRSNCCNKFYYDSWRKNVSAHVNYFTCYDNDELFGRGISDIRLVEKRVFVDHNGVTISAGITFHVNPRKLLGHYENPYICIVPGSEAGMIIPALFKVLKSYGFKEKELRTAAIRRLDICANIDMGKQESAECYLGLMRRGGYYMGLDDKEMPMDPVSHRRRHPPNEVRYVSRTVSRGGVRETLSIYLKHSQMQENRSRYSAEEIERAKGQVRFELRIGSDKVSYLTEKYKCASSLALISMPGEIGEDILSRYLEGLYGKGKFIKFSRAVKLIRHTSSHRKAVKEKMIQIVEQTRKTDMADAFHSLSAGSQYRNYFNELGISPITLRDSWRVEEFEHPVTYILTRNVNER